METKTEYNRIFIFIYLTIFYLLGLFLSSYYRPYIYSNNINDYGLADIGSNILFVPGVYFLILFIRNKPLFGLIKDIYYHLIILIFVEILSYFMEGIGTFDVKDILALPLGAGITYFIMKNKRLPVKHSKN